MARKRKGSDLAFIEGVAGLIGVGLLLVWLNDPAAGRALFQFTPWLVLITLGVAGALFLAYRLVLNPSTRNVETLDGHDYFAERDCSPVSPRFPKVEADRQRERILTLEEKLDRLDWFQFEKVVGMLYSSRGCQVERRGGANPDGGIDLVVKTASNQFAVQCKFWKTNEVGVRQVRELIGALQDARIPKGVIASIKGFTDPAKELAARQNIELLGKSAVLQMLNEARFTPHIREIKAVMESDDKYCPRCERPMLRRTCKKDGSQFWGCSAYPRCRSTMDIVQKRK